MCDREETLVEAALRVLNTTDPFEKASLGDEVAKKWLQGIITRPYDESLHLPVPDRPARLADVKLVSPSEMPKLGKAGSLQSRQAIVHSLVHTESWAIDLSWVTRNKCRVTVCIRCNHHIVMDIIARFGRQESMPIDFFTDFVKVAQDEGRHFTLLEARLKELGSFYGALPAHDGLWDSAIATSKDLLARLSVEHCVHEARGLDVLPTTISRFRKGGDKKTADLLEKIVYPEEITHCGAGVKWFRYVCSRSKNLLTCSNRDELLRDMEDEVIQKFHATVSRISSGGHSSHLSMSQQEELLDLDLNGMNLLLSKTSPQTQTHKFS